MTTATQQERGTEASRANPCLVCNSDHWCFNLSDDAVICGNTEHPPSGWQQTGTAKDGRRIFAKDGRRQGQGQPKKDSYPDPEELFPLRLNPKTDAPQWVTIGNDGEQRIEYQYPNLETGAAQGKVVRRQYPDRRPAYGRDGTQTKEIRPWHWAKRSHPDQAEGWWSDRGKGEKEYGYHWPLYRQSEALEEIETGLAEVLFYIAGEQAVEAGRCLGITAICNMGGEGAHTKDVIAFLLTARPKLFAIWPDNDSHGRTAAAKLLKECHKVGIPAIVLEPKNIWQDMPEKGDIYNVVTNSGMSSEDIISQVEIEIRRLLLERQLSRPSSIAREGAKPQHNSSSSSGSSGGGGESDVLSEILSHFEGRFRLNRLTGQVELDGLPIRLEEFYIVLRRQLGIKAGKQFTIDLIMNLARENEYSPVVEYLEQVSQQYGDTTVSLLDDMATRYFGTTEPVFNLYAKRFLIGAAARALSPGCKVDTALILQGKQGLGKSTFFSTLAGEWFDDSLGDTSNKDERLKLRAHWLLEWAELERAFSKRSTGDIKSFLSCCTDNLRVPYGRNIESFPRHCSFAGTTNEQEFLADVTGDRRFWVLPVQKNIDCKLLAQERDQIWAAAVALYRNGERWWFEGNEPDLSQELNKPFRTEDPWATYIQDYLDTLTSVSGAVRVYVRDILAQCLQIEPSRQDKSSQMRVAAILKRLGFTKKPDGKGQPCWSKVLSPPPAPQTPSDTSTNQVTVPSNNHTVTVSDTVLTPTDTCSSNLQKNVESPIAESEPPTNTAFVVEVLVAEVAVGVSNQDTATVSSTDTSTNTTTDTPPPAASDSLGVGDYVADKAGAITVITALARGGWLVSTGDYVSRTDIRERRFTKVSPPAEVTVGQSQAVPPTDDWDSSDEIDTLRQWLEACDSPEMLAEVRAAYPHPEALKTACKKLDAAKVRQIAQWVSELNKLGQTNLG